jgi:hypothetical protein
VDGILTLESPVPAAREEPSLPPAARPSAVVLELAAQRRRRDVDLVTLRLAAQRLLASKRELDAIAEQTQASVAEFDVHRATLQAQTVRGRRLAAEADEIAAAIEGGDLDTLLALRRRLPGRD